MRGMKPRHWVAASVAVVAFVVLAAALFRPPAGPDGAPAGDASVHQHDAGSLDPATTTVLVANLVVLLVIAVLTVRRRRRSRRPPARRWLWIAARRRTTAR
jgi:hypothetical protein